MLKTTIKFYPVENGDTTLIKLSSKLTILTDCKLRTSAEDPEDDSKFDVKKDLISSLELKDRNPFVDVFILTHADKDHCHGFGKHFFSGDVTDYGDANRSKDEIIIGELWVTSTLFTSEQSEDAHAVRKEANRRIRLCNDNASNKNDFGNRIRLIGYDSSTKFQNVEQYVPGQVVKSFNGKLCKNFSLFIHSPFKDTLITSKADKERNSASIVYQACFSEYENESYLLMGGDADHYIWAKILEISRAKSNDKYLKFNIFLAPHHCSWTFFNDVPYENSKEPQKTSLEILDYGEPNAYIISSSRKVVNGKPNPPHYEAKAEYVKKLKNSAFFLNTAIEPNEEAPKPIIFEVSALGGFIKKSNIAAIAAIISEKGYKPYCNEEQ